MDTNRFEQLLDGAIPSEEDYIAFVALADRLDF